jgi:hypothetical protein
VREAQISKSATSSPKVRLPCFISMILFFALASELTGLNFSLNAARKASQSAKGVLPSARDSMWDWAHIAAFSTINERAEGTILCTSSRVAPLALCTFFSCESQSAKRSSFALILNSRADSESLPLKTTGFSTMERNPKADRIALILLA